MMGQGFVSSFPEGHEAENCQQNVETDFHVVCPGSRARQTFPQQRVERHGDGQSAIPIACVSVNRGPRIFRQIDEWHKIKNSERGYSNRGLSQIPPSPMPNENGSKGDQQKHSRGAHGCSKSSECKRTQGTLLPPQPYRDKKKKHKQGFTTAFAHLVCILDPNKRK